MDGPRGAHAAEDEQKDGCVVVWGAAVGDLVVWTKSVSDRAHGEVAGDAEIRVCNKRVGLTELLLSMAQ